MVSVDGAQGKFPKMQTWGYVMGAYLAGDTPWDGYIEAREIEVCFSMRRTDRKKLVRTSDTLLFEILKSHKFVFGEFAPAFIKRDRDSSSLDSFKQAYHTIVGRYIPDSQLRFSRSSIIVMYVTSNFLLNQAEKINPRLLFCVRFSGQFCTFLQSCP